MASPSGIDGYLPDLENPIDLDGGALWQ